MSSPPQVAPVARMCVLREELPLGLDLGPQYAPIATLGYVLVGLVAAEGQTGVGWTFSIDPDEARAIEAALRARTGLLEGQDPAATAANWAALRASVRGLGRAVGAPAVSACDVALWDLLGRQRGEPVHRLLGAESDALRCYASDDLWASLAPEALAANAAGFAAEGFEALKIRGSGSPDPGLEAARVAAVRDAAGDDLEVLYDALQVYDVDTAIEVGRALEGAGVGWLEDPVPEDDLAGLARVRAALDLPVASGEDATWPEAHAALLDADAVDVLMVDPKWVGGLTPWVEVAGRAAAAGVRMTSHISPELSAPVLAAHAPDAWLEWFSWSFGLYETPPAVEAGRYMLPAAPGFGLHYRADLLERLFG